MLWLLNRPEDHFHRSVSVRLEIDSAKLHDGNGWKQVYSNLEDITPGQEDRDDLIEAFTDAVRTSYGGVGSFENVSFIAAWLRMARGFADNLPIHSPRVSAQPDPAGENFRWFTVNESGQRASLGNM